MPSVCARRNSSPAACRRSRRSSSWMSGESRRTCASQSSSTPGERYAWRPGRERRHHPNQERELCRISTDVTRKPRSAPFLALPPFRPLALPQRSIQCSLHSSDTGLRRYSTSAVECGLKSSSYRVQSDSFSVIGKSSRLDIGVTYCTRLVPNDMTVFSIGTFGWRSRCSPPARNTNRLDAFNPQCFFARDGQFCRGRTPAHSDPTTIVCDCVLAATPMRC